MNADLTREWTTQALQSLVSSYSQIGVCADDRETVPLFSEELKSVAGASAIRVRDFTAGRSAARHALSRLGLSPVAVPQSLDRAPFWPKGVVGSISHTDGIGVAVVARIESVLGIGIDIEKSGAVTEDLWSQVFTERERSLIDEMPAVDRRQWATAVFCIKEAFFKMQYPRTRTLLSLSDAEVTPGPLAGSVWIHTFNLRLSGYRGSSTFIGKYTVGPIYTLAAVEIQSE